jgi:hypothetical protein
LKRCAEFRASRAFGSFRNYFRSKKKQTDNGGRNANDSIRRSFCWARLYAQLIRIPPIHIWLEKVRSGLLAISEHSD